MREVLTAVGIPSEELDEESWHSSHETFRASRVPRVTIAGLAAAIIANILEVTPGNAKDQKVMQCLRFTLRTA